MKNNKFQPFGEYLEPIARKHGRGRTFDDFLQIIVCCLSMGRKEELYFKTIKPYDKDELNLFSQAFASLVMQMDRKPLVDPFGDYFEELLSNAQNGQFFTPEYVCDLMVSLTHSPRAGQDTGTEADKRVYDPACGSGRLLLSSAKLNRNRCFMGSDISYTCCLMTLINLCLNSLNGEVLHMNTLSNECWHRWIVIVDSITKIPTVYEVEEDIINQPPTCAEELKPMPVTGLVQPVKNVPPVNFVRFSAKC